MDQQCQQIDKRRNSQPWLPGDGARVCSLHFLSTDYKTGIKTRRLVPNAVPSVFPHYPSYMQPKENKTRRKLMRQELASAAKQKYNEITINEQTILEQKFSLDLAPCIINEETKVNDTNQTVSRA